MLKEELTEEYEADKQAALTQLSQQKELEMMAAREGWQRKVEDLLEQVKDVFQTVHPLTHFPGANRAKRTPSKVQIASFCFYLKPPQAIFSLHCSSVFFFFMKKK